MLRRGKFLLTQLHSQPQSFEANETTDWVLDILKMAAPEAAITGLEADEWAQQSNLKVELELSKMPGDEDYSIKGHFVAAVPTVCAHCADLVKVERSSQFLIYLKLVEKTRNEEDLDSGDADLIYILNPEIDVRELVAEQLILQEPFAEVPSHDFEGKAHICSQTLEIQTGQDPEIEAMSPFSKLAQLKLND